MGYSRVIFNSNEFSSLLSDQAFFNLEIGHSHLNKIQLQAIQVVLIVNTVVDCLF